MRAFLSIRFLGDNRNRDHVEAAIAAIEAAGFSVFCFVRDAEEWGKWQFPPEDMMRRTLNEIDASDYLIADVADWPIGVGVEAGYARGRDIPVVCICQARKRVADTVAGVAEQVIRYEDYDDLTGELVNLLGR